MMETAESNTAAILCKKKKRNKERNVSQFHCINIICWNYQTGANAVLMAPPGLIWQEIKG